MIRFNLNNIDFVCDTTKEAIELINYFCQKIIGNCLPTTQAYIEQRRSQNARYAANVRWNNHRMRKTTSNMRSLFSS